MDKLVEYIVARARESTAVSGLQNLCIGVLFFYALSKMPTGLLPDDAVFLLKGAALLFLTKGASEIGLPNTTKAGVAVQNAKAQAAVEEGSVVVPPSAKGVPPP